MSQRRPRVKFNQTPIKVPKIIPQDVNFRVFLESEVKLETFQQEQRADTALEITIPDRESDEYKAIIDRKKKRAQEIQQIEDTIYRNSPRFDELDIRSANSLIKNINQQIKSLDEEILNTDEDTDDQETILDKLKDILNKLEIKEAELRQESVNNFTRQAKSQRKQNTKNDQNKVFNQARRDAENTVKDIFIMDHGEIASMFSTDTSFLDHSKGPVTPQKNIISWPHIIRGREGNVIPLSPGIQIPKKFDRETNQYKNYIFTLSSFFKNPKFIAKLNEYYNPLGIELSVNQDKKYKNKWWIRLRVISIDGKINFPGHQDINLNLEVTQTNPFEEE